MATSTRKRLSRDERIVEEHHSLRRQMTNLQRDYAELIQQAERAKGRNTKLEMESRAKAQKRVDEIGKIWKEISGMNKKVAKAQVAIARKEYIRTKPGVGVAYQIYGEGVTLRARRSPEDQREGRRKVTLARRKIDPHVQAILSRQVAERQAIDSRSTNWKTPPSRIKRAWKAVQGRFRARRRAA